MSPSYRVKNWLSHKAAFAVASHLAPESTLSPHGVCGTGKFLHLMELYLPCEAGEKKGSKILNDKPCHRPSRHLCYCSLQSNAGNISLLLFLAIDKLFSKRCDH